ncbi:hypothetical protein NL50_03915 [Clostridium acetobutylicum]|nr:hypothetical protein NL50_03915 [Clostridium acetobutylicum]
MKKFLIKMVHFGRRYKKKIIITLSVCVLSIAVIGAVAFGIVYSRAQANAKYSQTQLKKIALSKAPGSVEEVEKRLNFREQSFQYRFKIKNKNNMLKIVRVDSKYGTIVHDGHGREEGNFKRGFEGRRNKH